MTQTLIEWRKTVARDCVLSAFFAYEPSPLWMHELTRAEKYPGMPIDEWDAYGWNDDPEEYDAIPSDDPDDWRDEAE